MPKVQVAHGWDVALGTARDPGPRVIVVGGGYWAADGRPGYSGFDGQSSTSDTTFQADSRRTLQAMVKWLTGKSTGASVLILIEDAYPNAIVGRPFGNQFQNALLTAGHTVTVTGNISTWDGFEPLDYDLTCMSNSLSAFNYHGMTTAQDKVNYVIDNYDHGGRFLADGGAGVWSAYGFDAVGNHPGGFNSVHATTMGPPKWLYQRPFYCPSFGRAPVGGSWSTDKWALSLYTTQQLDKGTNTRGGFTAYADCEVADDANAFESHYPPETYVLGLWWRR